jgi:tetratricopeptide (TPR) repeat protein
MPISGNTNPLAILNDMMRKRELYGHLGRSIGYSAGTLFYPHWIWVGRRFYNKGSSALRRAKRPIRNGNWNVAEQIMLNEIKSRSNKASGRAKYNLALVYEGQGRIEEAIAMAERAAAENGTRLSFDYINVLKRRLNAQPRIVLMQD